MPGRECRAPHPKMTDGRTCSSARTPTDPGGKRMNRSEPWHNPGKWYVSPYNFAEEAVAKFNLPPGREVVFRDPSFSDEPQGVRYTLRDKIEIAEKFDEAGVGEIFHHIH